MASARCWEAASGPRLPSRCCPLKAEIKVSWGGLLLGACNGAGHPRPIDPTPRPPPPLSRGFSRVSAKTLLPNEAHSQLLGSRRDSWGDAVEPTTGTTESSRRARAARAGSQPSKGSGQVTAPCLYAAANPGPSVTPAPTSSPLPVDAAPPARVKQKSREGAPCVGARAQERGSDGRPRGCGAQPPGLRVPDQQQPSGPVTVVAPGPPLAAPRAPRPLCLWAGGRAGVSCPPGHTQPCWAQCVREGK